MQILFYYYYKLAISFQLWNANCHFPAGVTCALPLSLSNSNFGLIGIVTYISLNVMQVVPGFLFPVLNTPTLQTGSRQNRVLISFLCQKIKEKRPAEIRLRVMMEASSVVLTG